jgi:hypothetical protein
MVYRSLPYIIVKIFQQRLPGEESLQNLIQKHALWSHYIYKFQDIPLYRYIVIGFCKNMAKHALWSHYIYKFQDIHPVCRYIGFYKYTAKHALWSRYVTFRTFHCVLIHRFLNRYSKGYFVVLLCAFQDIPLLADT